MIAFFRYLSLDRLRPEVAFACIAGAFGLAIVFLTPPLQVPDEPGHWYRIYRLSQGHVVDVRPTGPDAFSYGGPVPASLVDCAEAFAPIAGRLSVRVAPGAIAAEFRRPLRAEVTRSPEFQASTLYSPIPYAPAALATFVGRTLALPPVALLYLGRLATLAAYVALCFCAIRTTPIGKWPAALMLTSPMSLFLAASLSADAMTIALTSLATATALSQCVRPRETTAGAARLGGAMLAAALCKSAYAPVVLMTLATPTRRWQTWVRPLVICAVAAAAVAGWSALTHPNGIRLRGDAPADQMAWVIAHPATYARIVVRTVAANLTRWPYTAIGTLGWMEVPLNPWFVRVFHLTFLGLAVFFGEPVVVRLRTRVLGAAALLSAAFLVLLANYLVWNKIGATFLEGIQGRYFLPLALLGVAIIHRAGDRRVAPGRIVTMQFAVGCYTVWALASRFYEH